MNHQRIAVIITCFNRRQKTLTCLTALFNQVLPAGIDVNVYLVDDGSTDGTGQAVAQQYPQVNIIQGNGQLFWNGGMRLAWERAMQSDYDFYLWLNDDTLIYPDALAKMLTTYEQVLAQGNSNSIIVGSTCDPETGEYTYGGLTPCRWWHPVYLKQIQPTDVPQSCQTLNGNCVLIPRSVFQLVGNLDPVFKHYAADHDYGFRAWQKGCQLFIPPGYVGTCPPNPHGSRSKAKNLKFDQQLQQVDQPKGLSLQDVTLQPFDEWKVYTQRHAGPFWPIFWLLPYRRLVWLSLLDKLKLIKAN